MTLDQSDKRESNRYSNNQECQGGSDGNHATRVKFMTQDQARTAAGLKTWRQILCHNCYLEVFLADWTTSY